MTGIKDVTLMKIGDAVGTDSSTIMNLGIYLEFTKPDVDGYLASNHRSGIVSTTGTKNMLFDWQRNTSPREETGELRKALIKAKLRGIAEKYLPNGDQILRCLKCDRIIAKITDVISKQSDDDVRSKVRYILGKKCLVQLMNAEEEETGKEYRFDVITMTTADVTLDEEVRPISPFEGYQKHRATGCKGCSIQIGWYYESTDGKSAPFYAVFLQRVIHDTYDPDNTVNVFLAENQNED